MYDFEDEPGPSDEFECKEAQRLRDQRQNDRIVALEKQVKELEENVYVSIIDDIHRLKNKKIRELEKQIEEINFRLDNLTKWLTDESNSLSEIKRILRSFGNEL